MQRWAKVDSIRSKLGSENEFDGITGLAVGGWNVVHIFIMLECAERRTS
jgi:hypothetical protein